MIKSKIMDYVNQFRGFSRSFTQILGLLNHQILASPLSLSESRIIYELGKKQKATATNLSTFLNIDKGYLSRILKKLEHENYIYSTPSVTDKRIKMLLLSQKGEDTYKFLDQASQQQIEQLLAPLSNFEKSRLVNALTQAQQILEQHQQSVSLDQIVIRNNIEVGDIGFVIQAHAALYKAEYNYSILLEQYVAKGLVESLMLQKPNRNKAWICEYRYNKVGFLFLVDRGEAAQLRYFFIYPEYRGIGLGSKLMKLFIDHLKKRGFSTCYLWTTHEQVAAATLYRKYGFKLTEEKASDAFGKPLIEQKYVLTI